MPATSRTPILASLAIVATALTGCGAGHVESTPTIPNQAQSVNLDPRACYIQKEGTAIHPDKVELVCGDNARTELIVEREGDTSAGVEVQAVEEHLAGWEIVNPQGAVYGNGGDTVVQVKLRSEENNLECIYYQPLGKPAEQTKKDCSEI